VNWLLDTNVVSEMAKQRPHDRVVEWLAARPSDDTAISVVTIAELRTGAARADIERRQGLLRWIDATVAEWVGERCLQLTIEILVDWLTLTRQLGAKGITRDAPDLLLAATSRVHGLTVVTRNVRHFANTGVVVYDPWNGKTHYMDTP
jgi:predicted nucleic acid-binding protein